MLLVANKQHSAQDMLCECQKEEVVFYAVKGPESKLVVAETLQTMKQTFARTRR
jgi:hypothetical protein